MFRKVDNNEQPVPQDENVRQELQKEGKQKPVQPMGNEASYGALLNQLIKAANADNEIDISGNAEPEEEIIPNISQKGAKPLIHSMADDPNNSMYLNSSHNIVNENNIDNRISLGGMRENDNDDDNLINNRISLGGMRENNNGPVQNNILPVIQNAIEQAAEKPDFYTDPEGPDPDSLDPDNPLNRDMIVQAPKLKKKKKKKGKKSRNHIDLSGNANDLNNVNQDMQPAAGGISTHRSFPRGKRPAGSAVF